MIKFDNVTKIFNKNTIGVKDINIEINQGDFVGVIGPNGSGKSTLVRLINGLYSPSKGNIYVDGKNTKKEKELEEIREKVGFVFQNPDNQIVATTVEDEVAFGLENLQLAPEEIDKRVDKALNYVNMISYKRKLTTNLSGGEKQLISFASIIAMETKYMIFDEPTSLIDKFGRNEIIKILKKLKKDKTIIFVSHFLEEIFISDKIIVMKEGEIEFFDTPYNLLNNEKILKLIKFPLPFLLKVVKKYGLRHDKYEFLHVVKKLRKKIDENRS